MHSHFSTIFEHSIVKYQDIRMTFMIYCVLLLLLLRCSSLIKCLEQIFTIPVPERAWSNSTSGKDCLHDLLFYTKICIFWNNWFSKMKCWVGISCIGRMFLLLKFIYDDKTSSMVDGSMLNKNVWTLMLSFHLF